MHTVRSTRRRVLGRRKQHQNVPQVHTQRFRQGHAQADAGLHRAQPILQFADQSAV